MYMYIYTHIHICILRHISVSIRYILRHILVCIHKGKRPHK